MDGSEASLTGQYYQGEDEDQGWMSWAWSFVPAIVSAEDEEGESESGFYTESQEAGAARPLHKSPRDPVVSVGFYCTKASVTFKVREKNTAKLLLMIIERIFISGLVLSVAHRELL